MPVRSSTGYQPNICAPGYFFLHLSRQNYSGENSYEETCLFIIDTSGLRNAGLVGECSARYYDYRNGFDLRFRLQHADGIEAVYDDH